MAKYEHSLSLDVGNPDPISINIREGGHVEITGASSILTHMRSNDDQDRVPVKICIYGPYVSSNDGAIVTVFEPEETVYTLQSPQVKIFYENGKLHAEAYERTDERRPPIEQKHDLHFE